MTNYTDYCFYIDTYKGNMPLSDFNRLVIRASTEVKNNIFDRDITKYKEEVEMATCSITDIYLKIEELETKRDKILSGNVKTESVGDYSRTFESTTLSDIDIQITNQKAKIKEELRMYLIDTGLLYRGM